MRIRRFTDADALATLEVFTRAIHEIASCHYTAEQLAAWAPDDLDPVVWAASRAAAATWIAEIDGDVAGFTDVDAHGYIDMLFVHPAYGRRGVATALLEHLLVIATATSSVATVNASMTARPLFERHGFIVVREQHVERRGTTLTNFHMSRALTR